MDMKNARNTVADVIGLLKHTHNVMMNSVVNTFDYTTIAHVESAINEANEQYYYWDNEIIKEERNNLECERNNAISNIAFLVDISQRRDTGLCYANNFIVIVDYNGNYYVCKEWSLDYNYFLLNDADPYEEGMKVVYFNEVTSFNIIDVF